MRKKRWRVIPLLSDVTVEMNDSTFATHRATAVAVKNWMDASSEIKESSRTGNSLAISMGIRLSESAPRNFATGLIVLPSTPDDASWWRGRLPCDVRLDVSLSIYIQVFVCYPSWRLLWLGAACVRPWFLIFFQDFISKSQRWPASVGSHPGPRFIVFLNCCWAPHKR